MDRSTYLQEGYRQLINPQHYRKLDQPITAKKITEILRLMLHKKVITNRQFNYLCPPDEPRPRRFYMLPKIHKPPSEWTIPTKCQKVDQLYQIVIAFQNKRPVGLIALPFIISFLATGNWPKIKLDDSAFFRTQSYITEICYFEYLLSFRLQKKPHFSPKFRAI